MKFRPQLRGHESADANPSADLLHAHLSAVYALAQNSSHVFASPLGPVRFGARHAYLPRFVFFGPHASDESWRLAFLAGFDRRDLRPAHAVLALVQRLAAQADTGHGLHLTFFPVVDAAGAFLGAPGWPGTTGAAARRPRSACWKKRSASAAITDSSASRPRRRGRKPPRSASGVPSPTTLSPTWS